MPGTIKVNGQHKKLKKAWLKKDGVWKEGSYIATKVSGAWREVWKDSFPKPSFLNYPNAISRGQTITWYTEDIPGANYEIQFRYNEGTWGASQFYTKSSNAFVVSASTSNNTFQMRVRSVAPTTHDSQSEWLEGGVRSLGAQKLSTPAGLTYPSSITRAQTVSVYWNGVAGTTYKVYVVYNASATGTLINTQTPTSTKQLKYDYPVSANTNYTKIQFYVIASKTGFLDSDKAVGSVVTLGQQQLAAITSWNVPVPYYGVGDTISWSAVPNAQKYRVEIRYYNGGWGVWGSQYWDSNRVFTHVISENRDNTHIQVRVCATATNYTDGPWVTSSSIAIQLPPLKTATWTATSVDSWWDRFDNWKGVNQIIQGGWEDENGYWGNYKGLAFFNTSNIRSTLAGKDIEKVEIYLYRLNTNHGYASAQPIQLYTHNYLSKPGGEPALYYIQGPFSSFLRGEGKWVTVSNKVAERIRDGSAAGIAIHRPDGSNYLRASSNVQIRVQYR